MKLPDLKPGTWVALDTETTNGLHFDPPELSRCAVVSLAWRSPKSGRIEAKSLPFSFGPGRGAQLTLDLEPDPNLDETAWVYLLEWLRNKRLIMHNGKFDCHIMATGTDHWPGQAFEKQLAWDTVLGSHELDPGSEAGLDFLERRLKYLDKDSRSDWLMSKKDRANVNKMPWPQADRYAAWDAEVTYVAFEDQAERFQQGEGDYNGFRIEMELSRTLFRLERRGIGYDAAQSAQIAKDIRKHENQIKKNLPFKSTLHGAKKYYFKTLGLTSAEQTAGGQPKLDDSEVMRLVAQNAPYAKDFQLLRKLETARSKWYESYAEMCGWDGRLRTSFSQAKVISGRLSATRVNLQAIPHDYQLPEIKELGFPSPRALFKPKAGKTLFELDLSQAELRVAAQEARCESMLELVKNGADIHGTVATQLFDDHPGTDTWDFNRSIGKRADFSFIFGVGPEGFQDALVKYADIYLSLPECQRVVARWRKLYPEFGSTIHRYMDAANHHGYVRLVNGRVRHFRSWEEQHKAFNQWVQGSLAELMKRWLIEADKEYPGIVLLTIHDSLVLEVPNQETDRVQEIQRLGEKIGTDWFEVPMVVDVKEWKAA
jgi:DNA polymerase-1